MGSTDYLHRHHDLVCAYFVLNGQTGINEVANMNIAVLGAQASPPARVARNPDWEALTAIGR